ncbi:MAG TPA: ATP synthase F1 subunit epsilon [Gemmataceae bacterium]|jgi:F-type H+-transporting ATPase subunit epsilon|nr:ATP synthase F1 subunit epsilon [Gemmataceae bacterium]
MAESSHDRLQIVIVTPERAVLDDSADFVALPMFDGELGVLPGRRPLIGRLGVGELRVKHGEGVKRFFIDGGFAQIRGNVVSVLTPKALPAEELKAEAAQQALQAAEAMPSRTLDEREGKDRAQLRARAQLRILQKVGRQHVQDLMERRETLPQSLPQTSH